jgi:hypothetical protein
VALPAGPRKLKVVQLTTFHQQLAAEKREAS